MINPSAAEAPPPLSPCPFLPVPASVLTAGCLAVHGAGRGPEFYHTALLYAQSLWLQGFPARALLLINRALGAELSGTEPVLSRWPLPYKAAAWIIRHHRHDQFLGNPRRHWQHLATRMVEPRRHLRTWRAWACWRIACLLRPDLPGDGVQVMRENISEPSEEEITSALSAAGHPNELKLWKDALDYCLFS